VQNIFISYNLFKKSKQVCQLGITFILSFLLINTNIFSQNCPQNIDFETGTFNGWTCHVGNVAAIGGENVISLSPTAGPITGQHTMYVNNGSGETDFYGGFPVTCPNGSGYSVKLGNTTGGAQAEGMSYQFTIPANRNTYSLIYHYAVVFQDPNHQPFQQPRLELEITNLTDNERIECSSFTFFPNGSPLPGFYQASISDTTPVWCKNWSAVTINLNGKAGKTIRLMFKTADCTFRRHFGYAYIDVNTECSGEFTGAAYCPDDREINIEGPYGYQNYTWYNNSFTQVLGTGQNLNLSPPPPPGTRVAVVVEPFQGYGCSDTLYANLIDTLKLKAEAGPDVHYCGDIPVQIGFPPKRGIIYNWSPGTGLSNPSIANPRASPLVNTKYTLTINSLGGGCVQTDSVLVTSSGLDSTLQLIGKSSFCVTSGDSAVLVAKTADSTQWFKNGTPITGATRSSYKATQSGTYFATLFDTKGCVVSTRSEIIYIETPKPGIRYADQYAIISFPIDLEARDFGVEYLWRPPMYLTDATLMKPSFTSGSDGDQLYTINITTAVGCLTVDTQLVKTVKEVKVYVPSAFTPNNDGKNDFLFPIMQGIKKLNSFQIFNRWGQLVYNMQPGHRGWDGNVSSQLQGTSVYVWVFNGLGANNITYTFKGTVTLIR
jgi:gliding motility-associated-like protein